MSSARSTSGCAASCSRTASVAHLQTLRSAFHSASLNAGRPVAGRLVAAMRSAVGGWLDQMPATAAMSWLLLQHLLEEARDAVGAQAALFQQRYAGGVGLALEGPAVAQRQQQAAAEPSVFSRSE